jgi:D-tyrosyl-tRNA(Tyr) deacylase
MTYTMYNIVIATHATPAMSRPALGVALPGNWAWQAARPKRAWPWQRQSSLWRLRWAQ